MGSSVFAVMLFFLVLSVWNAPLAHAASIKVVDLGYARFESDLSLVDGVTSFLGLRYAAPPTGNLSVVSCHRILSEMMSLYRRAAVESASATSQYVWRSECDHRTTSMPPASPIRDRGCLYHQSLPNRIFGKAEYRENCFR